MKIFMTCMLATGILATGIPEGSGNQVSEDADRLVQVGDIKMGCRIYGNGFPLVMIMGYGSTMKLWEPGLIRMLSPFFKLIVFDNRGMGNTEEGQRPFTIEQFADDTAGLMDALGIGQAHVLGWSMGALIAEELVLRHPDKVNKLVLYAAHCNAGLFPPSPEVIKKLTDTSGNPQEQGMRFISVLFPSAWLQSLGDRLKEIFYRPMGNIPPQTMVKQSTAIDTWKGCCDRLNEIKKPTLVISGTDDLLVPLQNAHYLAGKIPKAKLEFFENSGHGLIFQFPDKFSEKVLAFLGI
jgi:pimeloyl-ACP methyl ester carboxylesterase